MSNQPTSSQEYSASRVLLRPGLALVVGFVGAGLLHFVARVAAGWTISWVALATLATLWLAQPALQLMFGPVFSYEMTRFSRRKSTFITRLVYIILLQSLLFLRYFAWLAESTYFRDTQAGTIDSQQLTAFATDFFVIFAIVQYIVMILLTPIYVAGAVADEKQRRTLEFLLATDLSGAEIVLGKMAARVLNLLVFIIAGLPVIAFLQLFGGIDPELLLISTALCLITVVSISALGTFCSVMLKRPRDAIIICYMLVLLYLAISLVTTTYMIYAKESNLYGSSSLLSVPGSWIVDQVLEVVAWLSGGNILCQYMMALFQSKTNNFATVFNTPEAAWSLARFVTFNLLMSLLLMTISIRRLRRIALAEPKPPRVRRGRNRETVNSSSTAMTATGNARVSQTPPTDNIGEDGILWKEMYIEGSSQSAWLGYLVNFVILILTFIVPIILVISNFGVFLPGLSDLFDLDRDIRTIQQRIQSFQYGMNAWLRIGTGVLSALGLLAAVVRASGAISTERDRDTWISLIAAPFTAREMLIGKWLGCLYGQRKMALVLVLMWGLCLVVGAVEPFMMFIVALYYLVFLSAFTWIGLFFSLHARNSLIASMRALLVSIFLGGGYWVVIGLCCILPLSAITNADDIFFLDEIALVLASLCPPFLLGYFALLNFSDRENFLYNSEQGVLAPLVPLLGLLFYLMVNVGLALLTARSFMEITNRQEWSEPPAESPGEDVP